ncbi:MAG: TonB-dependent receptor [Bacteroidota bacterium]
MRLTLSVFTLFLLLSLNTKLYAQSVNVSGIVLDVQTGEPVEGANVAIQNIETEDLKGGITDRDGVYRVRDVSAGRYTIRISYVGYIASEDSLTIEGDESLVYSVNLEQDSAQMGDVVVSAQGEATRLTGGHQRISAADLGRVITPAGSGDLVNYIQALPGVVSAGDRGGQLFVRGGTPSENLAIIDGLTIYQPFHIVGFFSAFPEELISSADFYTSGFRSKYGGRVSSVLDVSMRQGNYQESSASASLSPHLLEITADGPLKKGELSWLGSFRSSQIERTAEILTGSPQPIHFDSQFLKLSRLSDDESTRCSGMLMRTYDRGQLDFEFGDSFNWTNFIVGGKCTYLSQDPEVYIDVYTGISHFNNQMGGDSGQDLSSGVTKLSSDIDISQYVGDTRLNYGFFSHMKWLNYDIKELLVSGEENSEMLLGFGGYFDVRFDLGDRYYINPGLHMSIYTRDYQPSPEPRFKAGWYPFGNDNSEVTFSYGIYRQTITGISDLRDAGTSFVAWIETPDNRRMTSHHLLAGWRQKLSNSVQVSAEGYYKNLNNVPVTTWSNIAEFTTNLDFAEGDVRGADVRIEFDLAPVYGYIGYGYTETEYNVDQELFSDWFGTLSQTYNPSHDRRHQINAMLSADIKKFTATVRWQYGSGLPYTRQMGADGVFRYGSELPSVWGQYGIPRVLLDRPYSARTPHFHRLDVSAGRTFTLGSSKLTANVGAINAYDQQNLFYYDLFTQRRIDQLPVFPYLSLKAEI